MAYQGGQQGLPAYQGAFPSSSEPVQRQSSNAGLYRSGTSGVSADLGARPAMRTVSGLSSDLGARPPLSPVGGPPPPSVWHGASAAADAGDKGLLSHLKYLDAFPKQREEAAEFFQRTTSGGVITLVAGFFMVLLFFSELRLFTRVTTNHELSVDTSRGEQMEINFDITFPRMPCAWMSIDAMDVSGELHLDVQDHDVYKKRLTSDGYPISEGARHEVGPSKQPLPKGAIAVGKSGIAPVPPPEGSKDGGAAGAAGAGGKGGDAAKAGDAAAAAAEKQQQQQQQQAQAGAQQKQGGKEGEGANDGKGSEGEHEGKPKCGSCYGAEAKEGDCCNTCEEVREAYRRKGWALLDYEHVEQCHSEGYVTEINEQKGEGCHVWGKLLINKVAGNFHFAPGRSYQQGNMHIHDLSPFQGQPFDFSHTIHKLAFGEEYPGMKNPLDGAEAEQEESVAEGGSSGVYQYFLKVVPTRYTDLYNDTVATNQFSVTEHFLEANPQANGHLPGLFFFYDLSPIKVSFQEERLSLLAFLTSVCAIIGGIFTVSGIIDASIYHGSKALKKKLDLGKQF